jgi:hypothetical protein
LAEVLYIHNFIRDLSDKRMAKEVQRMSDVRRV